ncbi:MAG: tRNA pseudouridine(38-40) synthase TruA [Gammaproteobacteria bacterium]|nr:tRNA pseudouridine(38-40) synthase TruA [Gammaproteobacteria bacterium]MCH9744197.1 tRNA pseudouridine(38-40) synthase TruA [Gammaproteobacteria bacterium]
MDIKRIALGVRYDGANYRGWQVQDEELPTVQGRLERSIARVANHPITTVCAGRTDAGVHATAQVVHFDTSVDRRDYSWVFGSNSNLPSDISILWAKQVSMDFHARYSAVARTYRYIVYNHPIKPAILRHGVGWFHKPLEVGAMLEASQCLLGEHDFSSFRGADCQSNTAMRNLQRVEVVRRDRMVIIEITANAFLLHMIRNIVGTLVEIGCEQKPVEWMQEVLEARDRRAAGATISPNGLYLVKVDYPDEFELPINPTGPYFLCL